MSFLRSQSIRNIAAALILVLVAAAPPALAQQRREREPNSVYSERRAKLAAQADAPIVLWGYTGLLSLGQCLYFALGGYMMGMYLMRMIGSMGQYHMPIPDFLVFLGWTRLPPFWKPFSSFSKPWA